MGGNGTQFTIAILTSHCKQATIGFKFLYITRGSITLSTDCKNNLIVRCYEEQAAFRLLDIIFGQNGGRGKTERQRIVCFIVC